MELEEAIKHAEEVAASKRKLYEQAVAYNLPSEGCLKCAEDHEQLAEWLKQLKRLKEAYESDYQVDDLIETCVEFWG